MGPQFKRKRQSSHTSSGARTSHTSSSRGRFKRPSVPSHSSPQRRPIESAHSQAASRRHTPQDTSPPQAQTDHVAGNDEINEDLEQVVMAIDRQQKGTVGCAYYVAREETLYCLQDMTNGSLEAIEKCESYHVWGYLRGLTNLSEIGRATNLSPPFS
jgi:DNA mismatch repair protein MSH5